jgi:hypothetical protein
MAVLYELIKICISTSVQQPVELPGNVTGNPFGGMGTWDYCAVWILCQSLPIPCPFSCWRLHVHILVPVHVCVRPCLCPKFHMPASVHDHVSFNMALGVFMSDMEIIFLIPKAQRPWHRNVNCLSHEKGG